MMALVQKDWYVLWKQMKLLYFIMVVFAFANGNFGSVFIVIWAAMLPYTAMAYDERCKWDQLAAMMPYSVRDIVLSKYLLGLLCSGIAAAIAVAAHVILTLVPLFPETGSLAAVFLSFCGSLCVLDITLPLMLRFGVERGRMVLFLLIFLVCGGTGALSTIVVPDGPGGLHAPALVLLAMPLAAAVLTAISIPMSLRLYAGRKS